MSACQETKLLASTGACLSREVGKETIGTEVQIQRCAPRLGEHHGLVHTHEQSLICCLAAGAVLPEWPKGRICSWPSTCCIAQALPWLHPSWQLSPAQSLSLPQWDRGERQRSENENSWVELEIVW